MIELTEQQVQALENPNGEPPLVMNPRTGETFVLLRIDEYTRMKEDEYDDNPWTREELEALAWQAGEQADWDEYDAEARRVPENGARVAMRGSFLSTH